MSMELDIHERDIDSEVCQACGACCRVSFRLPETTTRYRRYLRQIGYTLYPAAKPGTPDCCNNKHDVKVDMGECAHLEIRLRGEDRFYRCRIYGTPRYPELCEQYNCVSWAKANDTYSTRNALLMSAQKALYRVRRSPGNS